VIFIFGSCSFHHFNELSLTNYLSFFLREENFSLTFQYKKLQEIGLSILIKKKQYPNRGEENNTGKKER